ncbi:MAG: hypothetical protein HKN32_04125, partial [Flavobacteriales bacterium]|nr:hypothetical protein [Flavobacteriales bacterium]
MHFYSLPILDVRTLTADSKAIVFDCSAFPPDTIIRPGQYITVKVDVDGSSERRSYSISRYSQENSTLEIGVKRVPNGKVSNLANSQWKMGDSIECSGPEGNFTLTDKTPVHHVFFAAGSGITPIIHMVDHVINSRGERATLFFGNSSSSDVMYKEELRTLSSNPNLSVLQIFTDGSTGTPLTSGRIDFGKATQLVHECVDNPLAAHFYMCGPSCMIDSVTNALEDQGVSADNIHLEYFVSPDE